jgi:flagellar assembly protein FliH
MSSKLRRGLAVDAEVNLWEPVSRNGIPARVARPAVGARGTPPSDVEQLLHDLETENNQACQAAYNRGLQEGTASGRQQSAAQMQPVLERLARTIDELAAYKPRLRHDAEEDVIKLALAISRRILYRELATDPEALLGLVRSALDRLDGREVQRVRLHPQDAPAVQQKLQNTGTRRHIEVLADASLERGSAVFDTAQGSLDASIDTQLKEIERGFADLVRRPS